MTMVARSTLALALAWLLGAAAAQAQTMPQQTQTKPRPSDPVSTTCGRQPASAAGTFSSVARSWARAVCSVGLVA